MKQSLFTAANAHFQSKLPNIIIDGNNLAIRYGAMFRDKQNRKGQATGALYGFVKGVFSLLGTGILRYKRAYIAFDYGRSARKESIRKGYKGNRIGGYLATSVIVSAVTEEEQKNAWFRQLGIAQDCCKNLGLVPIAMNHIEADDVIAWLSKLGPSIIISTDTDFHHLLSEDVTIIDPPRELFMTRSTFDSTVFSYYGKRKFSAEQTLLAKAIAGDKGDNIAGVAKYGWKRTTDLIGSCTTLEELFTLPNLPDDIRNAETHLRENITLINLHEPDMNYHALKTLQAIIEVEPVKNAVEFWNTCRNEGLHEFFMSPVALLMGGLR